MHPLRIMADASYGLAILLAALLLQGIWATYSYPLSTLFEMLLIGTGYAILCSLVYVHYYRGKRWALRLLPPMILLPGIYLIVTGGSLDHTLLSNPAVTPERLFIMRIGYYGSLVCMAACVNALSFRSEVALDKSTIPWPVNLAGLMMFIIGLTYCSRFSILYYFDIPLYEHSRFVVLFVMLTISLLSLQYFGKYGPLYRNHDGRQAFTTISTYLFIVSWIHILLPLPDFIAHYYHYTLEQVQFSHMVSRNAAIIELIASATIFILMRHDLSKRYYRQFKLAQYGR